MKQLLLTLTLVFSAQADWKQWRGPNGDGHTDANLPTRWSEDRNVKWRTPIPGKGWSSPVIEDNQIWFTTAFETLATEAETKERLKKNTGGVPVYVLSKVRLHAVCIDKQTGKLLHNLEVLVKNEPQWVHKLNSYASPTPIIENGRLYCHFGANGSACVDTRAGKVVWRNQEVEVQHENGPGSTPVLWKDLLIFHMDGSDQQFVMALDKATGKERWRARPSTMRENPQLKILQHTNNSHHQGSPRAPVAWLQLALRLRSLQRQGTLEGRVRRAWVFTRAATGHRPQHDFYEHQLHARQAVGRALRKHTKPDIAWSYTRGVSTQPSPLLVSDELFHHRKRWPGHLP